MPSYTLFQAVALAVTDMSGTEFSAFEVTQYIRDKVNKGEMGILGASPTIFNGKSTFFVSHDEVRQEVEDLARQKGWDYRMGSKDGHQFRLFSPKPIAISVPAKGVTPSTPAPSVPKVRGSSIVKHDNSWIEKAHTYVERQHKNGNFPTLKAVQSRLKGWSVSLDALKSELSSAFTVDQASPAKKNWTVRP